MKVSLENNWTKNNFLQIKITRIFFSLFLSFERWLLFLAIVNERFCNLFTEAEDTPKHLAKLKNVEYKISAKNDPHRLKDGTYFPIFKRVQPVFCADAVMSNYLLECFQSYFFSLIQLYIPPCTARLSSMYW